MIKRDIYSILFILVPFIYLFIIYEALPELVPIHWNIHGEVDALKGKRFLVLAPALPLLTFMLLSIVSKIDPKNQLDGSTRKHRRLKGVLTILMSAVAVLIMRASKNASVLDLNLMFFFIGVLYVVMGNYMKTIKPNYFLGIRTPWTLQNEEVWKSTHELGGLVWFIGGSVIALSCLIFEQEITFWFFIATTAVMTIIPVVYSYLEFKKSK